MATRDLYVAVWEKAGGAAWAARHGLTSQAYQAAFNQMTQQGYRPRLVSGYALNGTDFYAALWDKSPGPAWAARHGLTSQAYQATFDELTRQGFRPVCVSGYELGGRDFYAAIWEKSGGPAWAARHGLSSEGHQALFSQHLGPQGYRPVWIDCYAVGGQDRYASIWVKAAGPAWVARHGLREAEFDAVAKDLAAKGYHLRCARACMVGGQDRYAALWEMAPAPAPVARHGMTSESYQLLFEQLPAQGYRPAFLTGYAGQQPDSAVLRFSMQRQQQSNWCWAATATSVALFYDPNSGWTQCAVANGQLSRNDCCGSGAAGPCNVYGFLDDALNRTGHFVSIEGGSVSAGTIMDQMLQRRPLGIRVAWSGGGAHFIAATGRQGEDLVFVSDCGSGSTSVVPYETLRTRYAGSGSWTHTYYTKP